MPCLPFKICCLHTSSRLTTHQFISTPVSCIHTHLPPIRASPEFVCESTSQVEEVLDRDCAGCPAIDLGIHHRTTADVADHRHDDHPEVAVHIVHRVDLVVAVRIVHQVEVVRSDLVRELEGTVHLVGLAGVPVDRSRREQAVGRIAVAVERSNLIPVESRHADCTDHVEVLYVHTHSELELCHTVKCHVAGKSGHMSSGCGIDLRIRLRLGAAMEVDIVKMTGVVQTACSSQVEQSHCTFHSVP